MRSARRSRSKVRKPRYVSLRSHLAPAPPRPPSPPPVPSDMSSTAVADRRHQLDLFPVHPDPVDVACLLDDRGAVGEPTLAAILGAGDSSSPESPSPASLPSPSMNWEGSGGGGGGGGGDGLARRALRGRERWAFWRASSGPAAVTSSEEEVVSSAMGGVGLWRCAAATRALALKLDYEEILAAWSDRGPLYMDADGPQIVPQLCHSGDPYDFVAFPVLVEIGQGGGDAASTWKVPEKEDAEGREEEDGRSVIISREARVRRYKEKRGNRLFAKRIRYEVRKMNAEKRPRVKGRFVKKKDEDEDEDHS